MSELEALAGLSGEQLHILRHSLGLTYGEVMYRNHFVTGEGSLDHPGCMALVSAGLMKRYPAERAGGMDTFIVTDAGKDAARARSEPTPKTGEDA